MSTKTATVSEKVRKILAQARDRAGTAEGDLFFSKAFELMARYGLSEHDLQDDDTSAGELATKRVEFSGSYTDLQATLLLTVVRCLHCDGVMFGMCRSTRSTHAMLFGRASHLERAITLYTMLNPIMLTSAQSYSANSSDLWGVPLYGNSVVTQRRSYMRGFIATMQQRLSSAENTVSSENQGYALTVIDDSERANAACRAYTDTLNIRRMRRGARSFDGAAYAQGSTAAERTDIGSTRLATRRGLPPG